MSGSIGSREKRRIEILIRRMNHLRNRIDSGPAFVRNWDEAEYAALRWVLQKIGAIGAPDEETTEEAVGE